MAQTTQTPYGGGGGARRERVSYGSERANTCVEVPHRSERDREGEEAHRGKRVEVNFKLTFSATPEWLFNII